jgi:glutathione S-transferase
MYTVVGAIRSRAFRVMWALEELGQPYEHVAAAPRSEEARQFSPLGKIPALKDGDAVLLDSVAIMTYLADKHGALTYPAGTVERARQDAHIHFVNEHLDAPLWLGARHSFILPEDQRLPEVRGAVEADIAQAVELLAERIEGPFLKGETMTVADILAVHCLGWAVGAKFPVENRKVKDYAKDLRERAAFKAASAR